MEQYLVFPGRRFVRAEHLPDLRVGDIYETANEPEYFYRVITVHKQSQGDVLLRADYYLQRHRVRPVQDTSESINPATSKMEDQQNSALDSSG